MSIAYSFRAKLTVAFAVSVSISVGAAYVVFQVVLTRHLEALVGARVQDNVELAARAIDQVMLNCIRDIRGFAAPPFDTAAGAVLERDRLNHHTYAYPCFQKLLVTDLHGVVLESSFAGDRGKPLPLLYDYLADELALASAGGPGTVIMSDLADVPAAVTDAIGRDGPNRYVPSIELLSPVFDRRGDRVGVMVGSVNVAALQELLQDLDQRSPGDDPASLVDRDGRILLSGSGHGPLLRGHPDATLSEMKHLLARDGAGTAVYVRGTGEKVMVAHARLWTYGANKGGDWRLISVSPHALVVAPLEVAARTMLLGLALLLGLSVVVAFRVADVVARPVARLSAAAGAIAKGDYGARAAVDADDEVGRLGSAFNVMAAQIEADRRSLKREIAERRRAEEALVESRDAADRASQAKSEFLANMSHEIRTPMNAVLGMTDLMLAGTVTSLQRRYLSIVKESGLSLTTLINDILDFAKIEAGKLELMPVPFAVRDQVFEAVGPLAIQADVKGLELIASVDSAVPTQLVADIRRLRQVIVNLVGNAVKFTASGEVEVRVGLDPAHVGTLPPTGSVRLQFSVSDTGIGVPEDKQAELFQAFSQADVSVTRKYGGTGLGLVIARRLVEAMGGTIRVESRPGQGSTFSFDVEVGTSAASMPAATPSEALASLRALVVDDNPTNRTWLSGILEGWRMEPVLAASGQAALAELDAAAQAGGRFRVVLLDAMMPGLDGFAVAEEIRRRRVAVDIVMMLGAAPRPSDYARGHDVGISRYLTKPVRPTELLNAIVGTLRLGAEVVGSRGSAGPPRETKQGFLAGLSILVVEDNEISLELATAILDSQRGDVTAARDGIEAVRLAASRPFDVILMDIQMPGMDGLSATRLIRQAEGGTDRHTPIVALTAHAFGSDRDQCLRAGADAFLSKPVDRTELLDTIRAVTGSRAASESAQPARTVDVGSPFDPAWLLRQVEGDASAARSLVTTYYERTPALLAAMEQAIETRAADGVRRAAHTLRGSAGVLRAVGVSAGASALEASALEGDWTAVAAHWTRVRALSTELEDALRTYLEARS